MEKEETELQDSQEPEEESTEEADTSVSDDLESKNRQLYERAKKAEASKKDAEREIAKLKEKLALLKGDSEDDPDDDKYNTLSQQIAQLQQEKELDKVLVQYPVLGEKLEEFDSYRAENPGMPLNTAAKAFMVEKDLLGEKPKRAGLEKARGGQRTPPSSNKMSSEDVKRLRENDFRKYRQLVTEGKIQIAE